MLLKIPSGGMGGTLPFPTSVPTWNLTRWKPAPVLPPLQTADASKLSRV